MVIENIEGHERSATAYDGLWLNGHIEDSGVILNRYVGRKHVTFTPLIDDFNVI